MGAFSGLAGLATVLGPVLGAILTEADIAGTSWRPVFLMNIPVGVSRWWRRCGSSPSRARRAGPTSTRSAC